MIESLVPGVCRIDRNVPPKIRVMADSLDVLERTECVRCFLPTSSHPSVVDSSVGETGRSMECSLPPEEEGPVPLGKADRVCVRDSRWRSSSCKVFKKKPRYSSASSWNPR